MEFDDLLKLMVEKGGSDLFITAGVAPSMKVNGKILPITKSALTPAIIESLIHSVMTEKQRKEFTESKECQFAITDKADSARFRVSAFVQRDSPGMILRRIETHIPTVEDLKLPKIIEELAMTKRGIIIFVGATGTGKSTSLASMIGHRNRHSQGHIITIEDPIEFVHQHAGCIVTQREVGIDTASFDVALKNYAIAFAETGHLVLSTLHANNANQALDRIIHFFESDRHSQLYMDLSLNLKGIIAQQLIPTPDGKSRRGCIEVLLNSPLIQDYIRKGEIHEIKEVMKRSRELGMQTFDQALFDLYQAGEITYESALQYSDSPNDLRLQIKLGNGADTRYLDHATRDLSIEEN
jgi:twitching motility protein PilU